MKIITLGDVHGRDNWITQIGDPNQWDKIIFVGDYVDSYDIEPVFILHNLIRIVDLQISYPDKVVLLLGNHDISYVWNGIYQCSGYKGVMQYDYEYQFRRGNFQIAYQIENYLWTHAGVSEAWFNLKNVKQYFSELDTNLTIAEHLNELVYCPIKLEHVYGNSRDEVFSVGVKRGGWSPAGGPLWADKSETKKFILQGYHQIIGHTPVDHIDRFLYDSNENNGSITYIDTCSREFHQLNLK